MAKLGLGPRCSFQVSCTAVSQTLGQAAANKVRGLHVSASPLSLGQPAGDGGREAEGKETWEMSGLAPRSYATGHVVLVSSGAAFRREAGESPFVGRALSAGLSLLLTGSSGGSCFVGKAWQSSAEMCCWRGRRTPRRSLSHQTRGEMPRTEVHAGDVEKRLTNELQHTLLIFIWYIIFQNCLDKKPFWGYFLT